MAGPQMSVRAHRPELAATVTQPRSCALARHIFDTAPVEFAVRDWRGPRAVPPTGSVWNSVIAWPIPRGGTRLRDLRIPPSHA